MNPYTYSRARQQWRREQHEGEAASKAQSFFSALFGARLGTAVALAVVLFASVSVAAVTLLAHVELSGYADEALASTFHITQPSQGRVLGVASYGYNQPVCGYNTANCLNYQLVAFSGSGWQVRIDYQLQGDVTGMIRVNNWPFMDNIRGAGSGYTGYDLAPGQNYTFVLYRKAGSRLTKITSLDLTAPARPQPVCNTTAPAQPAAANCYYKYDRNGCYISIVCSQPSYGYNQPSYGYSLPNNGVSSGQASEGWIENVFNPYGTSNSVSHSGIVGWAYDNGKPVNVSVAMQNVSTGVITTITTTTGGTISSGGYRDDVTSYLQSKYGLQSLQVNTLFWGDLSSLPAGNYKMVNATFNGYGFYVEGQAQAQLYVGTNATIQQPVIASLSPTSGPVGTQVVITGSGFTSANNIKLSGPASGATGSSVNSTDGATLSFSVPSQVAMRPDCFGGICPQWMSAPQAVVPGSYAVSVTNANGTSNTVNFTVTSSGSSSVRAGSIINNNGTVQLVGSNGLYGFPDLATFNSWGYSFSNIVIANSAEQALSQIGMVPMKQSGCTNPLDQINGKCGASTARPVLTVGLNTAAQSSFVISAGEISQRVASFVITAGATSNANITSITIGATRNTIGSSFQNLRLISATTNLQLGATQAVFASNGSYTFTFNSPLVIAAGSSQSFDVYLDVATTASAVSTAINNQGLVSLAGVTGIWSVDSSAIGAITPVAGQAVTLAGSVNNSPLTASLSSVSPVSGSAVGGTTGNAIAVYNLTTSPSYSATVQEMDFAVTGSNYSPVAAVSVSGVKSAVVNNTIAVTGLNITVPAGYSGVSVPVLADYAIAGVNGVPSGSTFTLSLTKIKYLVNSVVQSVTVSVPANQMTLVSTVSAATRVGSVINNNGTVQLVGSNGLYGFPDLATFNSWGYSFSNIVIANSAEQALSQIGMVPMKQSGCTNPLDQINGKCGTSAVVGGLTLNPATLSLTVGQTSTVQISSGVNLAAYPPYVSSNSNPSVAPAGINGTQMSVTGASSGSATISVCLTGGSTCTNLYVTVSVPQAVNHAPTPPTMSLGPSNSSVAAGTSQQFNFMSSDQDSDALTFQINWGDGSAASSVAGQAASSGVIAGALHTWAAAGSYTIRVVVSDGRGGSADNAFTMTVTAAVPTVSIRYIQIQSTSNSWIAWREIQAYDASGKLLTPVSCSGGYSASSMSSQNCSGAYDGNVSTVWNSDYYNGTIILDYGSNQNIVQIKLLTENTPNPAYATHILSGKADGASSFTTLKTFAGSITSNQWIAYP